MESKKQASIMRAAITAAIVVAAILIVGSFWNGKSAGADTEKAVRSVSLLYLNELAERREQVVSARIADYISDMLALMGASTAELGGALGGLFSPLTAVSFLVFTLLYTPCVAAVAAIRRELGSGLKTLGVVLMQCGVAWIAAFVALRLGALLV